MAARKRTYDNARLPLDAPGWKPWRAEIMRLIRAAPRAERDLETLVAAGCDPEGLLFRLAAVVAWRGREINWKTVGLSRHLIREAPKKLREAAKLLERFQRVLDFPRRDPKQPDISKTICAKANELAEVIPLLLEANNNTLQVAAICSLVSYVKRECGKYHDEEISNLIAAATGNHSYMATHLTQWRAKHKRHIELMAFDVINPLCFPVPRT